MEELLEHITKTVKSGSYYICTPRVEDTDIDEFAVDSKRVRDWLIARDYVYKSDEDYERDFVSFRKGKHNVILVRDTCDLTNIELATRLCRKLNLTDKGDRITVFNTLRYRVVSPDTYAELDL